MDSINMLYLRYDLVNTQKLALNVELEKTKQQIESFLLNISNLERTKLYYQDIITNKQQENQALKKKHKIELEFYKKKASNKWIPYVIGFAAGGIAFGIF